MVIGWKKSWSWIHVTRWRILRMHVTMWIIFWLFGVLCELLVGATSSDGFLVDIFNAWRIENPYAQNGKLWFCGTHPFAVSYTVKNTRISTDILSQVFRILTEPVPYTFVSINRQNNKAWVHTAMQSRASLFRRFTDTNVYGTGPVEIREHYLHVNI